MSNRTFESIFQLIALLLFMIAVVLNIQADIVFKDNIIEYVRRMSQAQVSYQVSCIMIVLSVHARISK